MNTKRSLLLVALMLCSAAIACDLPDLGGSAGGNAEPVTGGPTNTPRVPPTFPPTYTPTPTLEATITATPGEVIQPTSESSPTPTSTPPPAGWIAHGTLGFRLILPEGWSVLDDAAADDSVKFEAVDLEGAGNYKASVFVSFRYQYDTFTIQEICDYYGPFFESVGMELMETKCGYEMNGLPAGRFLYRFNLDGINVREYMYFFVENTRIWLVELVVDENVWSSYTSTFQTIAESFCMD